MTDNAFVYRHGNRFRRAARPQSAPATSARPPYTPRWNGKVERFIQTLQNEWAYSRVWPNSSSRARSLQSFIRYYNRQTPTQLTRRPAPNQPRSQRPWAGQLGGHRRRLFRRGRVLGVGVAQVLVHEGDRHAALADGRGDALDRAEPDVAAREDARERSSRAGRGRGRAPSGPPRGRRRR